MLDQEQKRIMFEALYAALEMCGGMVTVSVPRERIGINVAEVNRFVDYLRTIKGLPTETFVKIATVLSEPHQYLTDEQCALLDVHRGAKTSRAIRNVLRRHIDFDHDVSNLQYTRFADAINPYTRVGYYTVINGGTDELGCHVIDVRTISGEPYFKVSW